MSFRPLELLYACPKKYFRLLSPRVMEAQKRPIRVGFIGLNAGYPNGIRTGVNWAANAHLPYLKWSSKYEIVALQNSSVARAEEAIKHYELPVTTKAYGTPEGTLTTLLHDKSYELAQCQGRTRS